MTTSARREGEKENVKKEKQSKSSAALQREWPPQLEEEKMTRSKTWKEKKTRAPYVCACLRCVMSVCATPFPTSSEVVKKEPPSEYATITTT
jgi:hypothetical protein